MASVGLPGLNGFVSEFLCLLGAFTSSNLGAVYGVIGAIGIILGAVYMLRLTSALLFGPLYYPVLTSEKETHETVHPKYVMGGDITGREVLVLTPLAIAVIFLGFYPAPLLHALERPLAEIRHADVQQAPVVQAPQAPASIALAQPTR
jgi:NADH-quinone oxidoreductase subunit M